MLKRKSLSIFLIIALTMGLLSGCAGEKEVSKEISVYSELVKNYYEAVDTEFAYDISYTLAYDKKYLSNELGFRTAGSESEHAAANYIEGLMTELDLKDVEKVPVTVDKWQFNDASFKLESDEKEIMPVSYATSGTKPEGITAELLDVGMGRAEDYEGLDVKGKIVLAGVNQAEMAWIDGPLREAYTQGAAAIITYDTGGYAEISDDAVNLQDVCEKDLIPCVSISAKDAKYFIEKIKSGNNMGKLIVDNEIAIGEGTSYNVIGKIEGKSSEQQIIVSGHYDVYFNGFQDDSCAIGLIMAMAKAMKDSGYVPENDIMFVAHGAEEWGASGSQNDWTTGAWEMIHNAKPEWIGKTISMLNFELPAYFAGDESAYFSAVPEYSKVVEELVNETGLLDDIDASIYKKGISAETIPTNTMEDGISYRFAGVPYMINMPSFESEWMAQRYHTVYDDADTYSAEVMDINLKMFGAMAIYLDQRPASPLDFKVTCEMLKESAAEDVIKASGGNYGSYIEAVEGLSKVADTFYKEGAEINKAYDEAFKNKDQSQMEALRKEGVKYNKTLLEAFKFVQDNLIGLIATSDVVMKHEPPANNIELIEGILTAIDKQEYENEEETGALDLAWQVNGGTDYYCYLFSRESVLDPPSMLFDETNPGKTFWGSGKVPAMPETGEGVYALLEEDLAAAKAIYEEALKHDKKLLASSIKAETEAIQNLITMLEK